MIVESPHSAGTIYMTAARHKTGDYAPYVYKTDDFGTTWTRIDEGLPQHEFCRVIREDPNREGLLYVGTELGIHVSFDGGGNWQSLQCNLPVTPIYDFVVKDTDLVVATHGRSFWILDDLTPLHQMCDELMEASRHLLRPRRRPPCRRISRRRGEEARGQELPRHQWAESTRRTTSTRSRPVTFASASSMPVRIWKVAFGSCTSLIRPRSVSPA